MASARGVWAIDVGANGLKALQMNHGEEGLEVLDFAYIEHSENLSSGEVGPDEKEQIFMETLQKFLEEKDLSKTEVAISVAGQNSFARFIKLPPVEAKKIPEVVQFEAVQQIPFDINEVEWDWQLMESADSPDKTVGLFAIKNELISEVMDHFTDQNLRVSCVQIVPMALYNYAYHDIKQLQASSDRATIILDMGAENTTLVVCTKDSVWQRSIRIGGNTFTRAIADAFKKHYATAEKLKRTAPMSKYMRQIYTAMKPVYTDLGGEIQRSLGFYSSSPEGRNKTFSKVIAMGGGIKLQGLCKYLTQTLGIPVVKPDSFESLGFSPDVSTAKFHENISDFGVAYGLGVQLLDEAKISTNLLPRKIARAMAWTRKSRMFTIAAGVLLLAVLLAFGRTYKDYSQYNRHDGTRSRIDGIISGVRDLSSKISELEGQIEPLEAEIEKFKGSYQYRDVVPDFISTMAKCLPNTKNNPDQANVYEAFQNGDIAGLKAVDRHKRKQLFVTRFAMEFSGAIQDADFPSLDINRTYRRPTTPAGGAGMDEMMLEYEMMGFDGGGPMTPPGGGAMTGPGGGDQEEPAKGGAGFTVLIEGYSPYRDISELLDPPGVRENRSRWGFITRLENLKKLFPNTPYELFSKNEITHFEVETNWVDLKDKEMPDGIGVLKKIERASREEAKPGAAGAGYFGAGGIGGRGSNYVYSEDVLVDPMTGEEISKTFDIITQEEIDADPELEQDALARKKYDRRTGKEMFIERDQWFRIKAKFIWKDAPVDSNPDPAAGGMDMYL